MFPFGQGRKFPILNVKVLCLFLNFEPTPCNTGKDGRYECVRRNDLILPLRFVSGWIHKTSKRQNNFGLPLAHWVSLLGYLTRVALTPGYEIVADKRHSRFGRNRGSNSDKSPQTLLYGSPQHSDCSVPEIAKIRVHNKSTCSLSFMLLQLPSLFLLILIRHLLVRLPLTVQFFCTHLFRFKLFVLCSLVFFYFFFFLSCIFRRFYFML